MPDTPEFLPPQPWLSQPETAAVMAALTEGGASARFVGGCVRDALVGRPFSDIDIATPLRPEQVMARLKAAGIHALPTGLQHGTVTAVPAPRRPIEVTTLRRDVETDGRHAIVAFTEDWATDAARRDFTMNALYADGDGRLHDPLGGGAADALAGIVRFVGEPIARLEEDVLRLLRFFRFYAHYGRGDADLAALAACAEMAPQLVRLSGERVWIELRKLLAAPDPLPAWELMAEHGALPFLLPAPLDGGARLAELLEVERELGDADPLLRLAALLEGGEAEALAAADRLRLSNAERDRLVALRTLPADFALPLDRRAARGFLHRLGPELFTDAVILRAARAPDTPVAELFEIAREGVPDFPLAGRDLLGLGLAPGPAVGRLLAALQEGWAGADFRPDRAALLAEARRRIAAGGI